MRRSWLAAGLLTGCLAGGRAPEVAEVAAAPEVESVVAPSRVVVLDEVEVVCARAVRCGTIGRSQLDDCRKGPRASRLTLVWGFDDALGIPQRVAQGRLKVVEGAAQACLDFLATAACGVDLATAPRGCGLGRPSGSYAPGVMPGGVCTHWDECIDGFCTAQPACEGVCKARVKLGETCGADSLCGEGLFCGKDETCVVRGGVGAVCGGHWQGCRDGLFCDGYRPGIEDDHYMSPETPGRCSAGKLLGEGCVPTTSTWEDVCAAGLVCDWGVDAPVCVAPKRAGDECRADGVCGDGLVCAGLVLGGIHPAGNRYAARTAGRCAPAKDAGDACEPAAFVSGCPASMVCDATTRVCRSTGHVGDPCVSSWVTQPHAQDGPLRTDGCFGGHYCEVATRTCRRQISRGGRCTPQTFGVEDEPCFLGKCDANTRRCRAECG